MNIMTHIEANKANDNNTGNHQHYYKQTPNVTVVQNNLKLQLKYPQPYSSTYSTLNKIIVDIMFSLGTNKDPKLIRAKILGMLNVIRQTYPEVKILPLINHNIMDTNAPQFILINKIIPINPTYLADYTGKIDIYQYQSPHFKIRIQAQQTYFKLCDPDKPLWDYLQ